MSASCPHESATGTEHPDVWICDGCGEVFAYVDDPHGQIVQYRRGDPSPRKLRRVTIAPGS